MPISINEARIEVLNEQNKICSFITISQIIPETLFEASDEECLEWGEERIQLLEETRYEYEIEPLTDIRVKEIPDVITASVLKSRSNTGTIKTGTRVGLFPILFEDSNGNQISEIALEIRSAKLEYREHYRKMLDYIAERCTDLLLQVKSPTQLRLKPDIRDTSGTIAQKFFFIKFLLSNREFLGAINRIISSPHVKSSMREHEQNISRGFKPDSKSLKQIGIGQPRFKICENIPLSKVLSTVPRKITILQYKEVSDTPENKFVKFVLENFDDFLNSMIVVINSSKLSASDKRLLYDIENQRQKLSLFLSHNLFRGLSKPTFLPLGSPVLQRKEGYREILSAWLRFDAASKLIWKGGDDVFGSGKRDISNLYEYWIFFKLIDLVSSVFKLSIPDIEDLIEETSDGFSIKLKAGKQLLIEDISEDRNRSLNVRFSYNRTFSNSLKNAEITFPVSESWTKNMKPDYSLSIWPTALSLSDAEKYDLLWHVHFDAKYKISDKKSKLTIDHLFGDEINAGNEDSTHVHKKVAKRDSLLTMHAYRDAIRRTEGAYIIYPGNENVTWRKFYEILPGLGAFAINPGMENDGLDYLYSFLSDMAKHIRNRFSLREREQYYLNKCRTNYPIEETFIKIPEIEPNGERAKPIQDRLALLCPIDMENKTFEIFPPKSLGIKINTGDIDPALFQIDYAVLFENGRSIVNEIYKVQTNKIKICTGSELIKLGFSEINEEDLFCLFEFEPDIVFESTILKIPEKYIHNTGKNDFILCTLDILI